MAAGLVRALLAALLAALLVSAGAALDGEMAELARMLRESCVEETGADVALIEGVNAGAALSPDPKLKCYIKCVMETAGMMADGVMDVEAAVAVLPPELQQHAATLRRCGTQQGADDCDTAYRTQECWQQGSRQDYILI